MNSEFCRQRLPQFCVAVGSGGAGTKTMEHMSTKAFSKKNRSTTTPHFFSVILVPYTKIFSIQKSDPPTYFFKDIWWIYHKMTKKWLKKGIQIKKFRGRQNWLYKLKIQIYLLNWYQFHVNDKKKVQMLLLCDVSPFEATRHRMTWKWTETARKRRETMWKWCEMTQYPPQTAF